MQITVNGAPHELPAGTTMSGLIEQLGLVVGSVVVEHNGTALLRSEVQTTPLSDGDVLELVRAVAGG
ncbi:MAG: thiamine biosynthesis protein ThiS [Frankiales bacterium]|nr:thiamine biosynthesis protein ThiS [Frankiales bacterium]